MKISKQIKRNNLLDQGVHLLMTHGYHAVGINEVAKAAQVSKGSFYSYFDSKEAFAVETISHYIEPFIQLLKQHIKRSPEDALAALKNYYAELIIAVAK